MLLSGWVAVCALAQDALPGKAAPAIAADEVKPADAEAPAWLGIVMEVARNPDPDDEEKPLPGVGVMQAVEGGPAKKAGLRQFDRVLKLDGKVLKDAEDLRTTVRANKAGKEVKLRVLRDGKEQDIKVTLEQMPAQQNLLMFQGAINPQLKPDKVQFFNRPLRGSEDVGPDVILLADGNRLEGKVLSATNTDLNVSLNNEGQAALLLSEVTSVRLSGEARERKLPVGVLLRDGGWLAASRIGLKDKKVTLTLEEGAKVELDRAQVAEIAISNGETPLFGRGDGWKSVPEEAWVPKDGAWKCVQNQGAVLGRKFARLPAALEFSFDAEAAAEWAGVLTLFNYRLEDSTGTMGPGMVQIGLGGRAVSMNHFDGQRFYSLQSVTPAGAMLPPPEPGKPVHFAVFCDRIKGLLVLQVNGSEIGRYDLAKLAPADLERAGGVIAFRGQAGLTISNPTVRPWYGYLPKAEETISQEDQVIVADQKVIGGEVVRITDTGITLAGGATVPRSRPVLLKLKPVAQAIAEPVGGTWLEMKDGSAFRAESVLIAGGKITARTSFAGELTLPMTALRRLSPTHPNPPPADGAGKRDVLTLAHGWQLTGTFVPPMTAGRMRWKIPASRVPLEFPADEVTSLCLAAKGASPVTTGQVIRLCNGDWLTGEITGLDDSSVTLSTSFQPALRLSRAGIQSLFTNPDAAIIADTATGGNRWRQTASRNTNPVTFTELDETRMPSYSYVDGTYTARNSTADPSATRDGLVLDMGAAETAVSLEVTCSGFDSYLSIALLDQNAAVAFYLNISGSTVIVSRAMRPADNLNRAQVLRPEQFTFQLPPRTAMAPAIRLQIVPDPRARVIHLAVDGRKAGTCRLRKDEPWLSLRYAIFSPTVSYARRFSISDAWVAPWNGRLGEAVPRAPGEAAVVFANGDETVARLVRLAGDAVEVDSDATGPLTLPLARIVAMDLNPPAVPLAATHRVRLQDRGQLSASAVRIGEQDVTLTTALGELTLPLSLVREITFPKK